MIITYGDRQLPSGSQIVDRRLREIGGSLGERATGYGVALAEFAERGGGMIVDFGRSDPRGRPHSHDNAAAAPDGFSGTASRLWRSPGTNGGKRLMDQAWLSAHPAKDLETPALERVGIP